MLKVYNSLCKRPEGAPSLSSVKTKMKRPLDIKEIKGYGDCAGEYLGRRSHNHNDWHSRLKVSDRLILLLLLMLISRIRASADLLGPIHQRDMTICKPISSAASFSFVPPSCLSLAINYRIMQRERCLRRATLVSVTFARVTFAREPH